MVTDKFRPGDVKHPEPKQVELLEKGQDILKAEKKELKFTAHTIRSGESLTEICQQYGIPLKALYAVNQHTLDPKIIEKGGKIAYGAPTHHVGDKLNIPSQADVPNAVKYFDSWTKQTVAKQRLEKEEPKVPRQPDVSGEKPRIQTQVMDETHLAAKRAAMMVKVALETQHNKFRSQHEGQGPVDDLVDWFKTSTGLEHSSNRIEKEYQQEQQMVKLLEKAATRPDLKQFENLYRQCTGKDFNENDFSSGYKKPASLTFPDLHADYETSQAGGRRVVNLAAAAGVASLSVIPGTAEVTIPLAARLAAGTALGAIGSGAADYANTGKTDNLKNSMTDGAIVGASIPIAATVGIATEGTVLATGGLTAEGTIATGATIAARAQGALRVGAGFAGGAVGGGAAGGMIEGSLTAKEDATKGKFDPGHIAQKTGEGVVSGALIGGTMGTVVPGLRNVLRVGKSAPAEAVAPIAETDTAVVPVTQESAAVVAPTEAVSKVAPPIKELPKTSTPQPPVETPKSTPQPDVAKGAAQQPVDVNKVAPQTTDLSKGATTQPDVTKAVSGEWSKGTTHNVPPKPDAADLNKGATQQPDVSKSTAQQKVDIQEGKQQPDVLKSTASPSRDDIWQNKIDRLNQDPLVKDIQPLELKDGWQGIQYERKIGGRTIREMYNPQDGSKVFSEQYKDGAGTPHREITITSADGQSTTNKFRLNKESGEWELVKPVEVAKSDPWNSKIESLKSDPGVDQSTLKEIPMDGNWKKVSYERSNGGRKIEEAVRTSDGTKYNKEEYLDGMGVPTREVTTTSANGYAVTNKFKYGTNTKGEPDWKFVSKTRTGEPPEPSISGDKPGIRPSDAAKKWAQDKIDDGTKWAQDKLKTLGSDSHVVSAREVPMQEGWKAVEYTDANGTKIVEGYNPSNGSRHSIKDYKENGVRYKENTLEVPSSGLKLWQKQKEVRKLSTGFEEDDGPQYEWRIVDTNREVVAKTQTE